MKWKKTVPSKPYDTTSRETCDFCGEEKGREGFHGLTEVTLEAKIGEVYPEGDCRELEEFDCCAKCWASKVVPALVALGGKLYKRPADESRLKTMPVDPNPK